MMHRFVKQALTLFALLSTGCGGHNIMLGTGGGGGNPTDAGGAGSGGATNDEGGRDGNGEFAGNGAGGSNPLCAVSGGTEITFNDEPDAQSSLVGSWVLCSGPGLAFATEQSDQAGVELTPDRHWYVLHQDDSGLSRATGFQASGTYRFQPPQDLNYGPASEALLFFGVDYSFVTVTMLDSPRKMRWQFVPPFPAIPSVYARQAP